MLLKSLFIVYCHAKGRVFGKTLFSATFTHFDCVPLSFVMEEALQLIFISRGSYSIYSCGFGVYMGGSGVKDLSYYHLIMGF